VRHKEIEREDDDEGIGKFQDIELKILGRFA
jgi:hypothetical protein